MYVLFAHMDPLMVLYHDGNAIQSSYAYNAESTDARIYLTDIGHKKEVRHDDDLHEEGNSDEKWYPFAKFVEKLIEDGKIRDLKWIEEEFHPTVRRMLLHIARMAYDKLIHHPSVFELFGLDLILDSDLNIFFIEMAPMPFMAASSPEITELNQEIVKGAIKFEQGILYGADIDKIAEEHNYHWVIDGRKDDIGRYHGLLSEDCL